MSVERFQSLPKKTQPTLHSSYKSFRTASYNPTEKYVDTCPQTSEFVQYKRKTKTVSRQQLYIHNLNIDYGRLERPNYFYYDGSVYTKAVKMKDDPQHQYILKQDMQTRRVTGISSLIEDNYIEQRNTEKKQLVDSSVQIDLQKTQQLKAPNFKPFKGIVNVKVKPNKQKENKTHQLRNSTQKIKMGLKQVHAYEEVNLEHGNRKRLHNRIVKMVVGGGHSKTKIICYPDNSQYLRLCGEK